MKQNITVAIDQPLLKQARKLAVNRGKSVSGLLADELRKLTNREADYERAKAKALAHLKSPFRLGGGKIADREVLHDRKGFR
ncbi:MAG: type II toxin-antitoxin system CcdA family antitoxin [Acidobacteria bacterium]|nr:type II toxin-antitoxin system CcdA family antitoxin [Acidobacteriota bacterium]